MQVHQPAAADTGAGTAAAAADPPPAVWPSERMCHSMTTLSDGRVLVFGGRNKDGICRDMWLADVVRHGADQAAAAATIITAVTAAAHP